MWLLTQASLQAPLEAQQKQRMQSIGITARWLRPLSALFNIVGHITTRRGPDVARGPDVVHHFPKSCSTYLLLLNFLGPATPVFKPRPTTPNFQTRLTPLTGRGDRECPPINRPSENA